MLAIFVFEAPRLARWIDGAEENVISAPESVAHYDPALDPEMKTRIISAARVLFAEEAEGMDLCSRLQWIDEAQDIVRWFASGVSPAPLKWEEAGIDLAAAEKKFHAVSLKATKTLMHIWLRQEAGDVSSPPEAKSCEGAEAPWSIEDMDDTRRALMRALFFTGDNRNWLNIGTAGADQRQ